MKKAYLVTVSGTVRVIANSQEEAETAALIQIKNESEGWDPGMIDTIQEDTECPYEEGEEELPEFAHSDLHSNFVVDGCFPAHGSYKTCIDQTHNSPECFQLTIEEDGNGEVWEYLYDDKESAHKDLEIFYQHLNALKSQS